MNRFGCLRKRKNKAGIQRYQMIVEVWKKGKKYYKSKTFSSEREAKKWGNKIRYEIENGIIDQESLKRRIFKNAAEKYIQEVLPFALYPRTIREKEEVMSNKKSVNKGAIIEILEEMGMKVASKNDSMYKLGPFIHFVSKRDFSKKRGGDDE